MIALLGIDVGMLIEAVVRDVWRICRRPRGRRPQHAA